MGFGQPAARQSALPTERAGVRELRHGGRRALRRRGRRVHPVERAQPAGLDAAAGRLRRASLHARLAERLSGDGPRRLPGDPRGRPRRDRAHRRARTGRRRPQDQERQHAPAGVPPRAGVRRRRPACGPHGRLPRVPARDRRRDLLPPAQHAPRAEPAVRESRQRGPGEPQEGRAPDRPPAAPGAPARDVDSAQPVAGRVRLPDQPARSPARRLARRPGPVSAAGRIHRLARPARHAVGAVPLAGRAGRGRTQVHRLAIGPARRRRRPRSRRWPTSTARSGSTSAPTSCGARSAPGPPTRSWSSAASRAARRAGSRSPRSRRGTTGRGRSPRRRSRSRRTAQSRTTAPRARR